MTLAPKTCGACSVCCKETMVELDGALKLAGVMCPHAAPPSGCGIYEARPHICRAYFCGWHHLPSLGDEWRPDRSEVLISFRKGAAPDGLMDGVEFELVGSPERITWLPLVEYIATLIVDAVPVYLSLPGEPGFQSPWVYLNDIAELRQGLARRDFAATTAVLQQALQVCRDFPRMRIPDNERRK